MTSRIQQRSIGESSRDNCDNREYASQRDTQFILLLVMFLFSIAFFHSSFYELRMFRKYYYNDQLLQSQ